MKGSNLPHPLNFEADARPGDPTAVSDPKCWITGEHRAALERFFPERVRAIGQAPTYVERGVLVVDSDASAQQESDIGSGEKPDKEAQ